MATSKEEYSNVIDEKELHREARKALAFESKVFSKTLGPFGMNTILEDRTLHHSITKDGYTVYQNIVLYNRVARAIARLIQKVSGSVNEIVGDGTTSAVVVGNELYRLRKLIRKHRVSPKVISEILKAVSEVLIDQIRIAADQIHLPTIGEKSSDIALKSAHEIIKNLASISLNNDYKKGELIADIFMSLVDPKNGFINVETSKTNKTYFDKDRGFELYRGMILPEMSTEPDGKTAIWDDPYILLVKGQLMTNDSDALNNIIQLVIGHLDKPLVIIAGGYSQAITEIFRQSVIAFGEKNNKKMPLLAVEIDTDSSIGKDDLLDIEANIGARVITVEAGKPFPMLDTPDQYLSYLGHAKRITSKMTYTRILQGASDKSKVEFRLADIDKEIESLKSEQHIDNTFNIFKLNRRRAILKNDMITLFVGGDTIEEKESSADLFDDAVRGCRSAANNGVVCGGNTIVAKIIEWYSSSDELVDRIISLLSLSNITRMIGEKKTRKIIRNMLIMIRDAYTDAFAIVINNKFRNKLKSKLIARKCIKQRTTYNLMTDAYETDNLSAKVINSADTDVRILIAATSIIDLIITSNQFLRVPSAIQMQKNM